MSTRIKTGGRTKGTPNKTTAEIRELFTEILVNNIDKIQQDLEDLEPKDRIKTLVELSKFIIPTLKSTDLQANFEVHNNTPLTKEEIIKRAKELDEWI